MDSEGEAQSPQVELVEEESEPVKRASKGSEEGEKTADVSDVVKKWSKK
jgi:hypothetical protein